MKNRIKVQSGALHNSYVSIEQSVFNTHGNSNESKKWLKGKVLESYLFDGRQLVLKFEDKTNMVISASLKKVEWHITVKPPIIIPIAKTNDVYFQYDSGNEVEWELQEILDDFIGNKIAFSFSKQLIFVFTKNSNEYVFDTVIEDKQNEKIYLVLNEA